MDNGSDYKPLLNYLKELEKHGVKVLYLKTAFTRAERASLKHYIKNENEIRNAEYYVVTDPDIAFENAPKDILETFVLLLKELKVDVVGPMLTIKDIPEGYPAREYAWNRHVEQFWMYKPKNVVIRGKKIYFRYNRIDTTFSLHDARCEWRRQKKGIRVYSPFEAKHLDWYFTPDIIPEDQMHYTKTTANLQMTHWSSKYWNKAPYQELPNWLRTINIVKNGKVVRHQLPKGKNLMWQIIPSFKILWSRIMYNLGRY